MQKKIDQFDLVDILSKKTGFYKKNIREVMNALEETIYENMQEATVDEPSEIRMFFGFVIGAKRIPAGQKRDPRNQNKIDVEEHLNPYTKFKQTFRNKVNNFNIDNSEGDDFEYDDEEA